MKKHSLSYLFIFVFSIISFAMSHSAYSSIPKVKEVKTSIGVNPWMIEDHYLPIVAVKMTFKHAGSAYDSDDKEGLAVLVSSLLDEGAGDLTAYQFQKKLEELAISISFNTDNDHFYISLKTLKENLDEALKLLSLALIEPRFDEDAVNRVKDQIKIVIDQKNEDPDYIAYKNLLEALYGKHPYARSEYGTKEKVAALTHEDLRDFVENKFNLNSLQISFVGDVTENEVADATKRYFSGFKEENKKFVELQKPTINQKSEDIHIQKDIPQTVIVFGKEGVLRNSPDFYPTYVLNHIVGGGGFESRLMHEIREKRGLAYSVYSFLETSEKSGLWAGGAGTNFDKSTQTISLLKDEIKRVNKHGVTEKELQDAKDYLIGSFPLKMTRNTKLAAFLSVMQLENLGMDFLERRNSIVANVDIEEINKLAYEVLDEKKLIMVVVGKK